MKLKDFIKTALCDIEEAVNESAIKTRRYTYLDCYGEGSDKGVLFDVAVAASTEASGKIGAEILSIGAKTEGKIASGEINRIKFVVKIGQYFPLPKNSNNEIMAALRKKLDDLGDNQK